MRPRFSIRTLLWLTVVVAAFFVGRQSHEIGARLAGLRRSQWLAAAGPCTFTPHPDGGVLLSIKPQATESRIVFHGDSSGIYQLRMNDPGGMRLIPLRDGSTVFSMTFDDNLEIQADILVRNGKMLAPGLMYKPLLPAGAVVNK
jgi:hypothetical protein